MAANTAPIYPDSINDDWGTITAANTAKDGTGTVVTIFTAGADGALIERFRVQALGTNVASVLRFFLNNGGSNATPANNSLIHEATCAATTISEVAALAPVEVLPSMPIKLEAGYKINIALGTAVAAGLQVTAFGGDF